MAFLLLLWLTAPLGMAYHRLLANIIGKRNDLPTKNILINMHYQKLILAKGKVFNISHIANLWHKY
jgi:hypothetical protein